MKGDIIIVEEYHRRAAERIIDHLHDSIIRSPHPHCISVSGESGSGKSETAQALADVLGERGVPAYVFQQDDYFVLPPKSNDARRREDISWVGTGEVKIALLDEHVGMAKSGAAEITKPLVIYDEDRVDTETMDVSGYRAFIAEGTYTALLANVDTRVFIDRNRLETLASRMKRGREPIEPFIEQVLEIEHSIIAPHRAMADIVITRDYDVTLPDS